MGSEATWMRDKGYGTYAGELSERYVTKVKTF